MQWRSGISVVAAAGGGDGGGSGAAAALPARADNLRTPSCLMTTYPTRLGHRCSVAEVGFVSTPPGGPGHSRRPIKSRRAYNRLGASDRD